MITRHKTLVTLVSLVLVVSSVQAGTPSDPKDPPQGKFSDAWMAVFLQGAKVGFLHLEQSRLGDKIHTASKIYMLVRRMGASSKVSLMQSNTETLKGKPLAFTSEILMSDQPILISGTIREGKITLTSEQFGHKIVQEVDYPTGALMPWGLYLETIQHELKPGTKIAFNVFEPMQALNVGIPITMEILGREEIELFGQKVPALKTRTISTINGVDLESLSWIDEQWQPLKQELSLLGMNFEMLICDKAFALKDLSGAELMVNTLIPIGKSIDRKRAKSVTYRIIAIRETKLPAFPETEMQKLIDKSPNTFTLQVTRRDHSKLAQAKPTIPPASLSPYLKPSVFITSEDPAVIEMAAQVAGNEKHPFQLAKRFCRHVFDTIEYKGLGTAFATAAEVCRKKTGDCTEHAVLLAALGRARGIPTRLVTGLIYIPQLGGQKNVLGFHMWTQYWINGKWIDLDAAWNQTEVDPTHIALGTHASEHASMGTLISSMMLKINDFETSVVDIELKP